MLMLERSVLLGGKRQHARRTVKSRLRMASRVMSTLGISKCGVGRWEKRQATSGEVHGGSEPYRRRDSCIEEMIVHEGSSRDEIRVGKRVAML